MLDVLQGGLEGRSSAPHDARTYDRNPHLHPAAQKLQKKLHAVGLYKLHLRDS
jgi:hypothetical protein